MFPCIFPLIYTRLFSTTIFSTHIHAPVFNNYFCCVYTYGCFQQLFFSVYTYACYQQLFLLRRGFQTIFSMISRPAEILPNFHLSPEHSFLAESAASILAKRLCRSIFFILLSIPFSGPLMILGIPLRIIPSDILRFPL